MSPTLTAHKTPSTAHDKTAGSPTSAASKSGAGRKSKPSFFSKLIRALVPCITPSAAHPVEIDVPRTPKSPEPSSSTVKSEKVPEPVPEEQKPQEPQVPQVAEESAAAAPPVVPEPEVKSPENAENVETSVQVQEEKEVVPTPHLLPEEETEGATSGAVVPPGATGISPPTPERQHHTQDEGHESDGTSFTEDDDLDEPLDDDDEEDRLIRQGGAGIPVGPVCFFVRWGLTLYSLYSLRTAFLALSFLPSLPYTLAESALSWIWTKPLFTAASRCVAPLSFLMALNNSFGILVNIASRLCCAC